MVRGGDERSKHAGAMDGAGWSVSLVRLAAVVALLVASAACAQEAPSATGHLAPNRGSIYRIDWRIDAPIVALATLGIAMPYLFGAPLVHPRCPCDVREVNLIDRLAIGAASPLADEVSLFSVGLAVVTPAALDLWDVGLRAPLVEDLWVEAEAILVDGALVTAAKYISQRPLPIVYAGKAPALIGHVGGYRSFFSGHTAVAASAAFAGAVTWTRRHGDSPIPWLLAVAVSGSVAAERVLAGRHFPSDVAVGEVVGVVTGFLIPALHLRASSLRFFAYGAKQGAFACAAAAF